MHICLNLDSVFLSTVWNSLPFVSLRHPDSLFFILFQDKKSVI